MIVDINTSLGRWPFQRFSIRTAPALARHLRATGIGPALVTSLDTILFPDPAVGNAELFRAGKRQPTLVPVPTVNPTLSNWRAIVADGVDLKAVRIVPNYHEYRLDTPFVRQLVEVLAAEVTPLIIQMRVEDERNQYPLMKVPGVPVADIVELANAFPQVPTICLCAYFGEAVELIRKTENVCVDLSFIETFQTLPTLLEQVPATRVLFGSHTPFFYTRPAVMKLEGIRPLAEEYETIGQANAVRLFGNRGGRNARLNEQ
ncbi:MAG: hypothetical protein K9N51_12690 [Candidatus Pacebacteria bacterium]|nr:hypothetical protein [Candidatus Paceibacterota bacterium]